MIIAGGHDALNCFKLDRKRICAAVVFVMVVAAMSLYYQHVENSWFSAAIDISDNISTLLAETDFDHAECSGDTLLIVIGRTSKMPAKRDLALYMHVK